MFQNPVSILFDLSGNPLPLLPNIAIPANTPGIIIFGSDGTNSRRILTATDGTIRVDPTGVTTQPVNVTNASLTVSNSSVTVLNASLTVSNSSVTVLNPSFTVLNASLTVSNSSVTVLNPSFTVLNASLTTQDTSSLADNAGFIDGTSRVLPSGYIFDEVAGTALTENDVGAARIDSKRAAIHVIEDATTRGTRATVKSASTAAVAGDTAIVVAISPNNSLAIQTTATTPTVASVVASTTSVQLFASNPLARMRVIRNDGNSVLYLGKGVTATTTMPIAIAAGQTWESPLPIYTGVINGIWSNANGNARIEEIT